VGAKHHHTSAKLNRGIDELFLDLTQQMISKADEKPKNGSRQTPGRGNNNITIVDDSNLVTMLLNFSPSSLMTRPNEIERLPLETLSSWVLETED
jgi:hypothetical protein